MRNLKTTTYAALFAALLSPGLAFALPPAILPVQGYITDSAGNPINGMRNVKFELFDDDAGGTSLYSTTITNLSISDGYFTAYLGDSPQPPVNLARFRDEDIVWMEISIGAETMTPRLQIGTVGFAGAATYCGDAETLDGEGLASFQSRVTGTCNATQRMVGINADGTVVCQTDIDTDTNTTYTPGAGLALTGTAFSLDATGCVAGEVLKRNAGNTDWDCVPDVDTDTDTNTTYTPGAGLALTGTAFSLDTTGCVAGEVLKRNAGNTDWDCVPDVDTDTNTTYTPGPGVAIASNTVSLDATGCVAGEVLKRNAGNTGWDCVPDVVGVDTNAGTLCNNGDYLDGDGTCKAVLDSTGELTPLLDATYVNVNEPDSVNATMIATDAVGAAEIATGAVGAAEIGANAVGTAEILATEVQNRVSGTCGTYQYMTGVNQNGSVTCADDYGRPGTDFVAYGGTSWTGDNGVYPTDYFGMAAYLSPPAVTTTTFYNELPVPDVVGGRDVLVDSLTVYHSCNVNAFITAIYVGSMSSINGYNYIYNDANDRSGSSNFTVTPVTPTAANLTGFLRLDITATAAGGYCSVMFRVNYHY